MRSEVSTKMNIPPTINVGFQKREDTYTKKLAYIVYTDRKGVLRKETSWQFWRDQKIPAQKFDNVPTSGFVLNKKVGGTRYDWHTRKEKVRVYDPRDFEFEIPVSNLLFILQEASSIRGKGLEGEFIYAWDGKDLVLLPVDCEEYRACFDFTEKQSKKVSKSEVVEGCSYVTKDLKNVMYLGRHSWCEEGGLSKAYLPVGKRHIFLDLGSTSKKDRYVVLSGFTNLSERTSQTALPQFAEEYGKYIKSPFQDFVKGFRMQKSTFNVESFKYEHRQRFLVKEGDLWYPLLICPQRDNSYYYRAVNTYSSFKIYKGEGFIPEIKGGEVVVPTVDYYGKHYVNPETMSVSEIMRDLELHKIFLDTHKNKSIDLLSHIY